MIPEALRSVIAETLQRLRIVKKNDIIEPADHNLLVNAVDKLYYASCTKWETLNFPTGIIVSGFVEGMYPVNDNPSGNPDTGRVSVTFDVDLDLTLPIGIAVRIPYIIVSGWAGYVNGNAVDPADGITLIDYIEIEFLNKKGDTIIKWWADLSEYISIEVTKISETTTQTTPEWDATAGLNEMFTYVYYSILLDWNTSSGYWWVPFGINFVYGLSMGMEICNIDTMFIGKQFYSNYVYGIPKYVYKPVEIGNYSPAFYVTTPVSATFVPYNTGAVISGVENIGVIKEVEDLKTTYLDAESSEAYVAKKMVVTVEGMFYKNIYYSHYNEYAGCLLWAQIPMTINVLRYVPDVRFNIPWYYEV